MQRYKVEFTIMVAIVSALHTAFIVASSFLVAGAYRRKKVLLIPW